jgi:hypothetical protein
MLTGFRNFISTAYNAVVGFFSNLGTWFRNVIAGTRAELKEDGVHWTFPPYAELAAQLSAAADSGPVEEVTKPGDKGRDIARQIRGYQLTKSPIMPKYERELNDNVKNVASSLGMAFEIGVVLNLITQHGLALSGNLDIAKLRDKYNMFVGRVRDFYQLAGKTTRTRELFIKLLETHIARMAAEIVDKSKQLMKCPKLIEVHYIGMDQVYGGKREDDNAHLVGNNAGADLIVICEGGEKKRFSTKFTSNPHSSIAKKSPAMIHRLFGGKGNRSDEYYVRIMAGMPADADPQVKADAVLFDLWESLKSGHASEGPVGIGNKIRLKGEWVANMFQSLVQGDYGTLPAWVNYAKDRRAVGQFSPAMQRDFAFGPRSGDIQAAEGAYGEASLEGWYDISHGVRLKAPAIKIKYVNPKTPKTRGTYLKFYVKDMTDPRRDRYAKYAVQVQMNNLTTK